MYRVMIIDDERALRNLIKKLVDWEKLGALVAGEAESGIEAINIIDDIQPDIALVDIRMPSMDGLTFATYMRDVYPDLKIIMVTAYQDFEYARECIKIGITQYVLKPVSKTELENAIRDAIKKVGKKHCEEQNKGMKIQMNQYIHFIEENYGNPGINLTYMARRFGFNAAYFSRKFKEKTGTSFIDYLTSYRIAVACGLAEKGMKMYQAADEVGIPDANYFSKCFKKYKNMTYSEYVKKCEGTLIEKDTDKE